MFLLALPLVFAREILVYFCRNLLSLVLVSFVGFDGVCHSGTWSQVTLKHRSDKHSVSGFVSCPSQLLQSAGFSASVHENQTFRFIRLSQW